MSDKNELDWEEYEAVQSGKGCITLGNMQPLYTSEELILFNLRNV
jgi:hypothetical protein